MPLAKDGFFKGLRISVRKVTMAVYVLADFDLPHPALHTRLPPMRALQTALFESSRATDLRPRNSHLTSPVEYTTFVTDFIKLLTALVPQLDRFGANLSLAVGSSIGTAEEEVFWLLWGFLATSCIAFAAALESCASAWPAYNQPFFASLSSAFHTLLVWLLPMTRSPAWTLMGPEHGLKVRNYDLGHILLQPVRFLQDLTYELGPVVMSHLTVVPPSYVPLLCCIASEQFSNLPRLVLKLKISPGMSATRYVHGENASAMSPFKPKYALLSQLINLTNNLAAADFQENFSGNLSFLLSPAVMHFYKVVLIMPWDPALVAPIREGYSTVVLSNMMNFKFGLDNVQAISQDGASPIEILVANQGPLGLPMHINPLISRAALETDCLLLHKTGLALSGPHGNDSSELDYYDNQVLVLKHWLEACKHNHVPATVLTLMLRSVVGLAKQCANHGLKMLQQARTAQQASCGLGLLLATTTPRSQQIPQMSDKGEFHAPSNLCVRKSKQGGTDGLTPVLWDLMYMTSCFQIHMPGKVLSTTGKHGLSIPARVAHACKNADTSLKTNANATRGRR